jgi:cathepsin B
LLVTVCVLFGGALASSLEDEQQYSVSAPDLIDTVNAKGLWVAGVNKNFVGYNRAQIKRLLGWKKPSPDKKAPPRRYPSNIEFASSFTSATNWPKCQTIGKIFNQADCGSCWAFGGVEAASDRFCIASNGAFNQALSFGQVTECTSGGCEGGSAEDTWDFIENNGIVTSACYPYFIPSCPPSQQPCLNFVNTPDCWDNRTCDNGQPWQKYYVSTYYGLDTVSDAQSDMMQNGPFEACFDVYEDFLSYKSGVYQHTSGSYLGGHCIKIQGWGTEGGLPYWLVNNSWTTYWGDKGQFKILRGSDECGIEDDMVAGTPQVSSLSA